MLRIKAVLILKRNATRDYLDFAALADCLGDDDMTLALRSFDSIYPQPNGESALQQLQIQLATPLPYDLDAVNLGEYKHLAKKWHDGVQFNQRVRPAPCLSLTGSSGPTNPNKDALHPLRPATS